MTKQIPYISPSSGLVSEGSDTGLHMAVNLLFGDKQKCINQMRFVAENMGYRVDNSSDIGRITTPYFAAEEYCAGLNASVGDVFPGLQMDLNNLNLPLALLEKAKSAYCNSKFE